MLKMLRLEITSNDTEQLSPKLSSSLLYKRKNTSKTKMGALTTTLVLVLEDLVQKRELMKELSV